MLCDDQYSNRQLHHYLWFPLHCKSTDANASLDRIDNTKGYEIGNIQWVHKDVNWMKHDFDQSYYIQTCKMVANNNA